MCMKVPFPRDVTIDDLERTSYTLERLQYLFVAMYPDRSIEVVRVINLITMALNRIRRQYEEIRLKGEMENV